MTPDELERHRVSMNFVLKGVAFFITEATEIKCDRAEREMIY